MFLKKLVYRLHSELFIIICNQLNSEVILKIKFTMSNGKIKNSRITNLVKLSSIN